MIKISCHSGFQEESLDVRERASIIFFLTRQAESGNERMSDKAELYKLFLTAVICLHMLPA